MLKKTFVTTAISALLIATLSGCGDGSQNTANIQVDEMHYPHLTESGDVQEKTVGTHMIPDFLKTQNENVVLIYKAVAQNTELLEHIPCYCGCGESAGHRSSKDCFVKEIEADGSIIWDDHGTKCNVCMEIALESIVLSRDGKTVEEIRSIIDSKYEEGYAAPTNTPLL